MLVLVLIGDAVATAAFLICPFLAGLAGLPVCLLRQTASNKAPRWAIARRHTDPVPV